MGAPRLHATKMYGDLNDWLEKQKTMEFVLHIHGAVLSSCVWLMPPRGGWTKAKWGRLWKGLGRLKVLDSKSPPLCYSDLHGFSPWWNYSKEYRLFMLDSSTHGWHRGLERPLYPQILVGLHVTGFKETEKKMALKNCFPLLRISSPPFPTQGKNRQFLEGSGDSSKIIMSPWPEHGA